MAVSENRDHFDYTWEFAAVEAPCEELAEILSKSNGFKRKFGELEGESFPITDRDDCFVVVYAVRDSTWTIVEPVGSGNINLAAVDRATKKLKTQSISACFCSNTAGFGYFHTRNGRNVEEFCSIDSAFYEDSKEQALAKGWQSCSGGHQRLKTKREIDVDLDNASGFQLLSVLSDELGADIPAQQWDLQDNPLRVGQFHGTELRRSISSAFLLYQK